RGLAFEWDVSGAVARERDGEDAELVGEETLVAAGAAVPVAPVEPAAAAAVDDGVGEALREAAQQVVRLARHPDAVERADEVAGLRVRAPAVLVVAEGVALHDVGEVLVRDRAEVAGEAEVRVRHPDAEALFPEPLGDLSRQ